MRRIAVDAMGTDSAPEPELEGAVEAARAGYAQVLLVGPQDRLRAELAQRQAQRLPIEIVHASEAVTMGDKATKAFRQRRDSSMRVAARLVHEGKADGMISAGNTGAVMTTAKIVLGALEGVDRPAIAQVFPTSRGSAAVLLDVGANVDCKAHHLVEFAVMGETYYRVIFGVERPRVGLLSIGEEETKGNELTFQAFHLLKALPINFVGNVEGRDLFNGNADVIISDGFVGNVALKVSEGVVQTVRYMLRESLKSTIASKVGSLLSRNAFQLMKRRLDYSEYGGAPLLGVKGACIVSHGSSNSNAIKNALRVAAEYARAGITRKIEHELAQIHHNSVLSHLT